MYRGHDTHGMRQTPEWEAYYGAWQRCTNSKNKAYKNYGGRGIKFLFQSFDQFFAELGRKPAPEYKIGTNTQQARIKLVAW
jgi:hypothetical protein